MSVVRPCKHDQDNQIVSGMPRDCGESYGQISDMNVQGTEETSQAARGGYGSDSPSSG